MSAPNYLETVKNNPTLVLAVILLAAMWFFSSQITGKLDDVSVCVCPGMAERAPAPQVPAPQ